MMGERNAKDDDSAEMRCNDCVSFRIVLINATVVHIIVITIVMTIMTVREDL